MTETCTFLDGPRDGTILLYDLQGATFRHLMQPSLGSLKKGMDFIQSGSPLNISAIHVFNSTLLMSFIFSELNEPKLIQLQIDLHLFLPHSDD